MLRSLARFFLIFLFSNLGFSAQIVTDNTHFACEEFQLAKDLKIYKDPTLFLSNLSLIYTDPTAGWESLMNENPLLTTLRGTVHMMKLGAEREFKNFGAIAKLYELSEPRLKIGVKTKESGEKPSEASVIVPVKICGANEPYGDSLGFVLKSDLKFAQVEDQDNGTLRPSTTKNPIPKLRKAPFWE